MNTLLERITINSNICHGKPTIRNKRYPVELILDLLSAGSTQRNFGRLPHARKRRHSGMPGLCSSAL
jgi:hypothetical protein